MGTAFAVRLKSSIASASAHIGDSFDAELDEPIVVQGKPIFAAGTPVAGTVVAVKRSAAAGAPAYLRLKATAFTRQGKVIPIESSSIFAKAGMPRTQQTQGKSGQGFSGATSLSDVPRTVRFAAGRRLTFRLTAPALLPR